MSVYEYKCDACGVSADKNFKFGQAPQTTTCECGQEMRKVFGTTPVMFKGAGWAGRTTIL